MKTVVVEPIGIDIHKAKEIAKDKGITDIVFYEDRCESVEGLIERIKDAEILVVSNQPISKEVLSECRHLKLISVAFTGIDHIDQEYCREKGIMICNSVGYSTNAVCEEVFGMIINLYRHLILCDQLTRDGKTKEGLSFFEMASKSIGVIGAGEIGQKVMQVALAFDMKVYCFSRTKRKIEGVEFVDLETLLKQSDIVTIHIPSTKLTKNMINDKNIALMKKEAILINTARGNIVNSEALAKALNEQRIAGAGIDVFEMEPPIVLDHPLLHSKNTLLAPHIGFATKEALEKRAIVVFENIKKYLAGDPQNIC